MDKALLSVENLKKTFSRGKAEVNAVNGVSFSVAEGEIFGIVGQSGSGKSTVLKLIANMEKCDSGKIIFDDEDIAHLPAKAQRRLYRSLQMVFQNPTASFNPRLTIRRSLYEPLRNYCRLRDSRSLDAGARELMEMVGLNAALLDRYASELSGGQCQRAAIARAISVSPRLLLCDEITSALDVSVQANIISLLCNLSKRLNMSILFVSHDIALVSNICRRSMVMHAGVIEESGETGRLIRSPSSAYTKQLIDSARIEI